MHAYDAQEAAGRPEPLPDAVALDGVGEYVEVSFGPSGAWPGTPGRVAFSADEGASWELDLTEKGVSSACGVAPVDAGLHGTASDLVLALYRHIPAGRLRVTGDRALVEGLLAWSDNE